MNPVCRITVTRLSIVELDEQITVTARQLKAIVEQSYEAGKKSVTPPDPDPKESFESLFGELFKKRP